MGVPFVSVNRKVLGTPGEPLMKVLIFAEVISITFECNTLEALCIIFLIVIYPSISKGGTGKGG